MNPETMTEIVELWVECLRRGLTAGLEYTPARNAATDEIREAYPDIQTYFNAAREYRRNGVNTADARTGMVLSAYMGQAAYRLKVELGLRPKRGGGTPPPPAAAVPVAPTPSPNGNGGGPSAMAQAFIEKYPPAVGDVICLGDTRLLGMLSHVSDTAWQYPFRPSKRDGVQNVLEKSGWRFEVIDGRAASFTVRVTAAPVTNEQKMLAAIEEIRQETERRIAEVMRQFGH